MVERGVQHREGVLEAAFRQAELVAFCVAAPALRAERREERGDVAAGDLGEAQVTQRGDDAALDEVLVAVERRRFPGGAL